MNNIYICIIPKGFFNYTNNSVSHILLDFLFKKYFKMSFNPNKISVSKYGKPLYNDTNIHFNISYSLNFICCAVSSFEIGVDIEEPRNINKNVIKKISYFDDYIYEPLEIWNIKEAYSKYIGLGLSIKFNTISVNNIKDKYFLYHKFLDDLSLYLSVCSNNKYTNIIFINFS